MPAKASSKDDNNSSSSGRKSSSSARPQEQALKCPRCDSQNTKFCYYNNYSLTQPRHFCKTCRRYWTKGGALRNVPIGGGCRKNKKMKSSSSRLSCGGGGDSKDSSSTSSDIGGLKFFHGLTPAMDFQLGTGLISFPRVLHHPSATPPVVYNQFSSFGDISSTSAAIASTTGFSNLDPSAASCSTTPLMGFNFPFSSGFNNGGGVQDMAGSVSGGNNSHNIASSIESLSSINQDLHWKLQQQRLAAMFCGSENQHQMKENNINNVVPASSFCLDQQQQQKPQTILFHNLDTSKEEEAYGVDNSRKEGETEWFFGDSFGPAVTSTPINNTSRNIANENASSWHGMQSWSNLNNQYSSQP